MKFISNNQSFIWLSAVLTSVVVAGLTFLPNVVSAHGGAVSAEEEKTEIITMVAGAVVIFLVAGFIIFKFLRKK